MNNRLTFLRQELLLIKARNAHVTELIQSAYSSEVPTGNLDVFCASNTTYGKYTRKGNLEWVHASGIMSFAHFATLLQQMLSYVKREISSSLGSLVYSTQ
jgi:hypothetical protein